MEPPNPAKGENQHSYSWPLNIELPIEFVRAVRTLAKQKGARSKMVKSDSGYFITFAGPPHITFGAARCIQAAVARIKANLGNPSYDPAYLRRFFSGIQ